MYKNLLIMTIVNSFLLINICVFGSMVFTNYFRICNFKFIKIEGHIYLNFYLNVKLFTTTLILFLMFLAFWTLSFTYFRNYLIIYYKVFTVALYDFEKVDNFEENEDFKNSIYACFKEKKCFNILNL